MSNKKKIIIPIIAIVLVIVLVLLIIPKHKKVNIKKADLDVDYYLKLVPMKFDADNLIDAYSKDKVTINNISDDVISKRIFDLNDKIVLSEEHQKSLCNNKLCNASSFMSVSDFEDRLKTYYNKFMIETSSSNSESILVKKKEMYYLKDKKFSPITKYNKIVKQQFEDDDYVIYEYAYFLNIDNEKGISYGNSTSNLVLKFNASEINAVNYKEYFDKKENYQLYKHTFKKNKNDGYYWYSTNIEKDV